MPRGEAKIVVMPNESGRIFITVEHEEYIPGKTWIGIEQTQSHPILEVDPAQNLQTSHHLK
ncbi:MAG: hypothetical protein R2883_03240 [Caldisericia bacterium]